MDTQDIVLTQIVLDLMYTTTATVDILVLVVLTVHVSVMVIGLEPNLLV